MNLRFKDVPKVCISLKRNKVRRDIVSKQFECIGAVTFIDAVDKLEIIVPECSVKIHDTAANGILACAMSHMKAIKMAKEKGWPAVCVFEDDVVFCDDFNERMDAIESVPELYYDIFALGGHFDKVASSEFLQQTKWDNIYQVRRMGGTYALIITEKCYDFILRNWNFNYGADEFYGNEVYRRFKTFAFVPFLCGTYTNVSDVTGGKANYENVWWYYQQQAITKNGKTFQVKVYGKKQLMDCTFIIPVRIDSADRRFNFMRVIQYLCDTLRTNIIIGESDTDSKVLELLKYIDRKECIITHNFERSDAVLFHRTRILNQMLSKVETAVTVNYDVDCLLRPGVYLQARDMVLDGYDLVYPYGKGEAQVEVDFPNKAGYNGESLFNPAYHKPWGSLAGHVQFFKTKSYIDGGMENEGFISYGPEDRERMDRFIKLGYKVDWIEDAVVYHLTHVRGVNSSPANPMFGQAETLYHRLKSMDRDQLLEYYAKQEYLFKYKR